MALDLEAALFSENPDADLESEARVYSYESLFAESRWGQHCNLPAVQSSIGEF